MQRLITTLFLVLLLNGCGPQSATPAEESPALGTDVLTLAIHPYDSPSLLVARFQPLVSYLEKALQRPLELRVSSTYEEQIRDIVAGRIDIAYMGPTPYIRAHDRYQAGEAQRIQLVAAEVACLSSIVVRRDSGIERVADLRGRTFAFGAHISFGSHYIPRMMLLREGIELADLRDYNFIERHERIAQAVLHGDYDAGGMRRRVAREFIANNPELHILATSPDLPPYALVARAGLDPLLIEQIRNAMIAPDDEGRLAIAEIGGNVRYRMIEDSDYDFARRVTDRLERVDGASEAIW